MRILTPSALPPLVLSPETQSRCTCPHANPDRIHTDPILLGQVHPDCLYNEGSHERLVRESREEEITLEVTEKAGKAAITKQWPDDVGRLSQGSLKYHRV